MNLYKYAAPSAFYPLAGRLIPWFAIPAALLFANPAFLRPLVGVPVRTIRARMVEVGRFFFILVHVVVDEGFGARPISELDQLRSVSANPAPVHDGPIGRRADSARCQARHVGDLRRRRSRGAGRHAGQRWRIDRHHAMRRSGSPGSLRACHGMWR